MTKASTVASTSEPKVRDTNFDSERKLYIPEGAIPGYVLYWFRGTPGRIASALRKGWEWVEPKEVEDFVSELGIGVDLGEATGSSDMGNRVSAPAQEGVGENGQYLRLYLMKLKKEHWDEDMEKYLQNRIEPIVDALKSGMVGQEQDAPGDRGRRYRPRGDQLPEMFRRKASKASAWTQT